MMNRRSNSCALCENSNRASICVICVNNRLNEYNALLKSLKSRRDGLYSRLSKLLIEKSKVDDRLNFGLEQKKKLTSLREELKRHKEQLIRGKAEVKRMSHNLEVKYGVLESARGVLEKARAAQLEKFYPNLIYTQSLGQLAITSELLHKQSVLLKQIHKLFPQRREKFDEEQKDKSSGQYDLICDARLPRGLDPLSVPVDDLAASLGYMLQLLNLVVDKLGAPALYSSGFAGSCSRIWQRDSYWGAQPSSQSYEHPLFIPRQNENSTIGESSWSDRSSSNFVVASLELDRRRHLSSSGCVSSSYSIPPLSLETLRDLKKGIALLKRSVACVTTYFCNLLFIDIPSEASTFEAFSKLLAILSSSKEIRSAVSLKMVCSRSSKHVQKFDKSVRKVNPVISSTLVENPHAFYLMKNISDKNLPTSPSFLFVTKTDDGDTERPDEWILVENPTLPPPSQSEDIEQRDSRYVY